MTDVRPGWVMLDGFVFIRGANTSLPEKGYRPLRAQGTTSQGVNFDIALCLADPPDTSRLYVLSPSDASPDTACDILAAHGNHFLFVITYFLRSHETSNLRCYQDPFICSVISRDLPPLLKRLPAHTEPLIARKVDGAEITLQRLFFPGDAGLLCRDEQVFAVAQLDQLIPISDSNRSEAEIVVLNTDGKDDDAMWEVKRLPILHPNREKLDISPWSTDTVISFKNYICWVDYCMGGILFFDAFKGRPDISYLDLPPVQGPPPDHPPVGRGYLQMYRGVSVTDEGRLLKFVHVDRIDGELVGPSDSGYTITSHTLEITEDGDMGWVQDDIMHSDPVLPSFRTRYDFSILKFPLVSMDDAHVVHFQYSEATNDGHYKISVVTVDMKTKALLSTHPYIKAEDRLGEDADMYEFKYCKLKSFLPIKFPMSVTRKRKLLD